jgi:hypothetical protein
MMAPLRQPGRFLRNITLVASLGFATSALRAQAASTIPQHLSQRELWQLNADFSEPAGYFRSDNLLSNETGFQFVIPDLVRSIKPGSVYLGVGPEQNFTYIAALKPALAIIFDIRRGNMIEHLMYKALFELSANRADFLSRLFSRPRPAGLDSSATAQQLFEAYISASSDTALYRKNLAAIRKRLTSDDGFALADSDSKYLEYVYSAFFEGGPQISYSFPNGGGGFGRGNMPTYASLQAATDSSGRNWGYLATEANYRWLRDFETRNLLVPVVGDFAGPKAIRSVSHYLEDHHAVVGVFYTSNVEQYLFQGADEWKRYYRNVATLPLDSTSSFIRSIGGGFRRGGGAPLRVAGQRMLLGGRLPSVTSSIQELLKAFDDGKILGYADVIDMSR